MTMLPDLESPFRRRARGLPSPLSEIFDASAWSAAFESFETTPDDRRLYEAALWIAVKARALYSERPPHFTKLGSAGAVVLAIAVLNAEYRKLSDSARSASAAAGADGPISMDYAANVRFENAHGQMMSSGDYIEAFVDALEGWLYDAARAPPMPEVQAVEIEQMVPPLLRFYSLRHILKRLFDKALHLGQYVDQDGIWQPNDRQIATLHQAWSARGNAVFEAAPAQLSSAWPGMNSAERRKWALHRSVTGIDHSGKRARLKVGRLGYLSKRPPQQPLARIGLQSSYLSAYLNEPLPLVPGLTPMLVENAWWVCSDAARHLTSSVSGWSDDQRTLGRLANAVPCQELTKAIARALNIELAIAEAIVGFLTFRQPDTKKGESQLSGWRGLWASPLVPITDPDMFLLPQGVFAHCDPLYRVEAWLERGGLNDKVSGKKAFGTARRGDKFEQDYRAQLCAAVEQNSLLATSRVAPQQVKRTSGKDGFPEQIDILFKLGSRLFVGELKFLLRPTDPHQWSRHYAKLAEAGSQAARKAAALGNRRDVAAKALGLELADVATVPITPLVLLNSGFGFSLEANGSRVIDAMYLRDFLLSPQFATGGAVSRGKLVSEEITIMYRSEYDAAQRFDAIMARPSVLMRFFDRVTWDVVDYPDTGAPPLRIATAFRGDMTVSERARRQGLMPLG